MSLSLPTPVLIATAAVAFASWGATWLVLKLLAHFNVYDRPNQRSSHSSPKPRGGGLALIPVLILAWVITVYWLRAIPPGFWVVLTGTVPLCLISWADDLKSRSAVLRIAIQATVVALGLYGLRDEALVFQGLLPLPLDRIAAGLIWLWFINLFNFMDGIDGITGVEAISLGLGLAIVAGILNWGPDMIVIPLLLAAAAAGFLAWNWAPSRIFLGDVGSIPLGYILGWLLLLAAMEGQWAAAAILPLYYFADATVTLIRRILRGATPWQAHREHFYQQAVQGGYSHAAASLRVLICNIGLIAFASLAASGYIWPALAGAGLSVSILMLLFARRRSV